MVLQALRSGVRNLWPYVRELQDEAQGIHTNLLRHGADRSGRKSCHSAWKEAFEAVAGGKVGTIEVPTGTYVSETYIWPKYGNVRIVGAGAGRSKVRLANGSNCPTFAVIYNGSHGEDPYYADMLSDIEIAWLEIDGNGLNQTMPSGNFFDTPMGISVRACQRVDVHHVYVHDCFQTGISMDRCADTSVCDSRVFNVGLNPVGSPRNGIYVYNGTPGDSTYPHVNSRRHLIDRVSVIGFKDEGIGYASNGAGHNVVISNFHVQGTGGSFTDPATTGDLGVALEANASPYTPPAPAMVSISAGTITDCLEGIGINSADGLPATPTYDQLHKAVTVSAVQIRRVQTNGVRLSGSQIQIQGVNVLDYGMNLAGQSAGLLISGGYTPVDDGLAQTHISVDGFSAKAYPGTSTAERSGVSLYNTGLGSGENIDLSHLLLEGGGTAQVCAAYSGGIMMLGDWRKVRISHFGVTGHRHGISIRNANADLMVSDGQCYRNNEAGVYVIGAGAALVAPTFDNVKCIDNGQDSGLTQRVGFYLRGVAGTRLRNCVATNRDGTTQQYALDNYTDVTLTRIEGGDFSGNAVGVFNGVTGLTAVRNVVGYNPVGTVSSPPALPASGVTGTNNSGVDLLMTVTGGTVTVIVLQGVTTNLTSGAFLLPALGTFAITYTVAPTLVFVGL